MSRRSHPRWATLAGTVLILGATLTTHGAEAAPPSVAGSLEYGHFSGAGGQNTQSIAGSAAAGFGRFGVFATGTRFDDTFVGGGFGIGGGLAVLVAPRTTLRVVGTRYLGDGVYRSWRLRAGPQLQFARGSAAGLWYAHEENSIAGPSDGVTGEYIVPLHPRVAGRTSLSYAVAGDVSSVGATLGMTWMALTKLELYADVGLAQNAIGATGLASANAEVPSEAGTDDVTVPLVLGLRMLMP